MFPYLFPLPPDYPKKDDKCLPCAILYGIVMMCAGLIFLSFTAIILRMAVQLWLTFPVTP